MSYRDEAQANLQLVADTLAKPRTAADELTMLSVATVAQAQATLAVAGELFALRQAIAKQGQQE